MMDNDNYLKSEEIREAFFARAASSPTGDVSYADLWSTLLERGKTIRGATPKRQRDAVWRALVADSRIERSAPGIFRVKPTT